jgi:hypothetical protein
MTEHEQLKGVVRAFFKYLDTTEESDEGRIFHPLHLSCCRSMWTDDINLIMKRMKELSKE